jgi:glycosyltransferase involved in cell wall biosynthesis
LIRVLVREHGINVVHQPIPVSPREPSLLFGFGVPVVIGPMNGGMDYPPGFHRERSGIERLLVGAGRASATAMNLLMPGKRRADLLLVANRRTREALPQGVSSQVGELVENGVDLSLWQAREPVDREPDADVVTFVFMGRLVGWKSVDLLLHAFASARHKTPMRLWILGDGDERSRLQAMAAALELADRGPEAVGTVHFAGWLSQSACMERLSSADCLVLPSLLECGGAVVLEAMSLAKPVIATAWGGPVDYLDASCGVLVPAESRAGIVTGIAAAMVDLATSPATRLRMGDRALAKVRAQYSWEAKVDRMIDFYGQARRSHARANGQGEGST